MRWVHPCSLLLFVIFVLALASPTSAATLTLAWDAPDDDTIEGYVVLYGTSSGVYTAKLDAGDVTTIPVAGLADGTKYFFVVQAYDESGALSEPSNEVAGTTSGTASGPGPTTPNGGSTPDGVTGTFRADRYLELAWLPAAASPDGYRVEVGTAFGETAFSALTPDHAIAFDMTDLPADTYYVRIRPVYGETYGHRSDELVVSPGGQIPAADPVAAFGAAGQCVAAPSAPRGFTASAKGSAVVLNWQRGAGEAPNGFVLQVGSTPGLQDVLVAQFAATDIGVHATASSAAYALRLAATNTCGASVWAPETILYVGVEPLPGAPPTLTQEVTDGLVVLTWEAPAKGRVTRYLIEAATPGGPFVYDTGNPGRGFANANTPPGQYLVTVRAGNATGFGPASRPVTVIVH